MHIWYIYIYIYGYTLQFRPKLTNHHPRDLTAGGFVHRSWPIPWDIFTQGQLRHPWASESGSPTDCCPNVHPQHSLQRCDSQPLRGTSPRPGSAVGTGNFTKMSHSHQESRCGINSVNSDKLENLEMLTTSTTLVSQQVGWSCAKSVDVPRTHHI